MGSSTAGVAYEPWLSVEPAAAPATGGAIWAGPAEVAVAVATSMGTAAVASYLNRAGWDDERRVVLASTSVAAERLREGAGRALRALRATVEVGGQGGVRHG